jgi:hypothetical protein
VLRVQWADVNLDDWTVGRCEFSTDVRVLTDWLPVQGFFETLVVGPPALLAWLGRDAWRYDSREQAQDGHAVVYTRVRTWFEAQS